MKSIKIVSSALIILIFATSMLIAQPGPRRQGLKANNEGSPARGMMMQIPDLTEQQKTAIREAATEMRKEILPLRNQVREKSAHLQTLRTQEDADLDAIHNTLEEIGELKVEIAKERATLHQEIRELLNEDQRIWLDTHRPMRRMKRGMNKGGMNRG